MLTDQAVGVFVGTAFPRVMRGGEVEGDTGRALELCVVVEFGAIVSGGGFEALRMAAHETHGALIGVFLGTSSELADHDVAGLAVDDGDEAVVITLANDGIDLPVTRASTTRRSLHVKR